MSAAQPSRSSLGEGAGHAPAPALRLAPAPNRVAARRRPALSIRWIVTASAVVLAAVPVLVVGYVSERNVRGALAREIETRLLLSARNLANTSSRALLGEYPELTLQPLIRTMISERAELRWAVVVDHRGIVQGHPDARQLGRPFTTPPALRPVSRTRPLDPGESLLSDARLIVARSVVHGPDGREIGAALVALDRRYADDTLTRSRRQQALALAILVLLAVASAFLSMSALLRPVGALRAGLERIGCGDFDSPIDFRDRTELGLLADSINEVAAALKRGQREMIERERLAHEIDLAREIQRSLLPASPFVTASVVIQGEQRPAAEVGGDAYDILPFPDGRVAVAIADVAGKGLGGCLVMAMLSVLLRTLRHVHRSPAALLAALDESLSESLKPGVFVTLFYGVVEPSGARITWASAGHNPALVYRRASGRVERCSSRGVPLGATRGGVIRRTLGDQVVELAPGDLLVQYTDAFTEAFDAERRELFGLERVMESVARHGEGGVEAVIRGLRADLERWTGRHAPEDDETLLVLGRPAAAADDERAAGAAETQALGWLEEARRRGTRLELRADLATLRGSLVGWMKEVPSFAELDAESFERLASALYEICANVAEHGYGKDVTRRFELWWVPETPTFAARDRAAAEAAAQEPLPAGQFVIRDDADGFRPGARPPIDFTDPEVWRRGRGLGLEIVHRVMQEVLYRPGTRDGNVTALRFGRVSPGKGAEPRP